MSFMQDLFLKFFNFLLNMDAFSKSILFSLFLCVVEKIIGFTFTCPCKHFLNQQIITSIFFGPFLSSFVVMFIRLRPFRYPYFEVEDRRSATPTDAEESQRSNEAKAPRNCPEAFAYCLIPPFFWITFLLLDGDYVACASTTWDGKYVKDQDLDRMWCQPMDRYMNDSEHRHAFQGYISTSQSAGYVLLGVFSVVIAVLVGIYDCFKSGKAKFCRGKHQDTQQGQQEARGGECELEPLVA
ncbi:hypothetical protein IRJ41_008709 [Triplophysa rosa]|uniref:Uncharacterized protein n=1 Tax=Triplophysa rosa TaxID=992332 RepID=A0A9W7T5T5_TRIRA|nr:hypothetical protein IRJ41_008709 [Triplophysa rosa]